MAMDQEKLQLLVESLQAADRAANEMLEHSDSAQVCRECNQQADCEALRQQLTRNAGEQEKAMLANATYGGPDAPLPEGYRRATGQDLQKLGLSDGKTSLLRIDGEPAFRAEAFVHTDPASGKDSYVIGFKGTNPASLSDWKNNFGQGMGNETAYYDQARTIGEQSRLSGADVSFTGHSLGGGLAAVASGASGASAQTFNAAGLSQATLDRLGYASPDRVMATHVQGDILNGLQDNTPMPDAYGTRRAIPPASGVRKFGDMPVGGIASVIAKILDVGITVTRGVRLHGIDSVQDALQQEEDSLLQDMEENGC